MLYSHTAREDNYLRRELSLFSACTNHYTNQLGMCELEARRQAVFLTSNDTVLMTSLDPNNCENYRTAVTCSATVISELGQKVYIAAGNTYKLADGRCTGWLKYPTV